MVAAMQNRVLRPELVILGFVAHPIGGRAQPLFAVRRKILYLLFADAGGKISRMHLALGDAVRGPNKLPAPEPAPAVHHPMADLPGLVVEDHVVHRPKLSSPLTI